MMGLAKDHGRRAKVGIAAFAAAALAVPLASTWALAQEPAQPAAAAALTAEQVDSARDIFNNFACSACHTLGDAGASGQIGPSLDGDTNIDHDYIVNRVNNGQGAMPGFGGQISDEDIDLLANYIMQVKK